ncbi:secreted frizzled-related protein 2-like [Lampris incognitus]|uniref:secreted frizzled-related protein 2-like n=1 Tax=Lampris incognitus TaxID=2546036 RepID=UPI0024B4D0FC|nr:secreted frizzled-related protein 2-like [Lampris incognitus]
MAPVVQLLCVTLVCVAYSACDGPSQPAGFRSSARSACKPIPSTLSLCHGVGYRQMRIPNLLGHDSLREAQQQSAAWLPLVSKLCHPDTKKFLCSLFAPVCLPELPEAVRPCRSLCEAVRAGCLPVMSAFGFPWPDMFNCTRFPRSTHLCVPPSGEPDGEEEEEEEVRQQEAARGSVICDACSLAAEGEADIQDNFCRSPYAFKLRLGSMSMVGADRQLVPHGRSRILRWAGGGAEKAEGVGGAMAHSALWLPEGGTCTCPGLDPTGLEGKLEAEKEEVPWREGERSEGSRGKGKDGRGMPGGWYLGLAQAEEGRLVLTRLVRWNKEDRELKKFIRALLKQPCSEP